jgi:glyoxylase-like metal-dependent hydrolase (beta-lactamase superfamily II)
MIGAHPVAPDTTSLSSYFPLPNLGILPVNAFVIKAAQPVLVDTGLSALRQPFLEALSRTIDPQDIRWIWLSHMDADHLGNLEDVLAIAPHAKVVTNFLGMGKMMLRHFDVSRVHLLEPGMTIDAGDRTLVPLQPAYYDAPETVGFFDTHSRVLFSADAFGTLLQEPQLEAAAIAPQASRRHDRLDRDRRAVARHGRPHRVWPRAGFDRAARSRGDHFRSSAGRARHHPRHARLSRRRARRGENRRARSCGDRTAVGEFRGGVRRLDPDLNGLRPRGRSGDDVVVHSFQKGTSQSSRG